MKLVICDIDNTLVVKHEPLSDYGKETIQKLKKAGWLFGLASGRTVPQLHDLEDQWNVEADVLIGLNGCEMYDGIKDEYKLYYYMEASWVKEALDIMSPFDTVPCGPRNNVWLSANKGKSLEESKKYLKNARKGSFKIVENYEEFYEAPMEKICFRVAQEDMAAIEAHAAKFKNDRFKTIKTETTMFEFCNIHGSKGTMLKKFCEHNQIDLENVWAFGDMSNDVDMLGIAGHSVCLLNGSDDAKEVSEYITEKPISEDGWAYFVEKHLL